MLTNILTKDKKMQVCGVKYKELENHKIINEKTIIITNTEELK